MGAVKLELDQCGRKVNKSDDALVCLCLVCVSLLSIFAESTL